MYSNGQKSQGRTLWIWDTLPKKGLLPDDQKWLNEGDAVENVHRLNLANYGKSSFDRICSGVRPPYTVQHNLDVLASITKLAKPGAEIKLAQVVKHDETQDSNSSQALDIASGLIKNLKLAGLTKIGSPTEINIAIDTKLDINERFQLLEDTNIKVIEVQCEAPNFEAGSSQLLSFAKNVQKKQQTTSNPSNSSATASTAEKNAIWSLDSLDDDAVDLIDPDTLIDEEDLKKPEASSLRVCGTTGKKKACKDCSCGLAEDLADGKAITTKSVNSSCGSCYLGDAFRCASCPYLGMPAFKPGEKIQLSERQLKADQ